MGTADKVKDKIEQYLESIVAKPRISLQEFNTLRDSYSVLTMWDKLNEIETAKAKKGVKDK